VYAFCPIEIPSYHNTVQMSITISAGRTDFEDMSMKNLLGIHGRN
jgi:hypothetical protein